MYTIKAVSSFNILLAVDDSLYSAAAVNLLTRITWPANTTVNVMAVVPQLPLMERSSSAQLNAADEALEIRRWGDWAAATVVTNEVSAQLRAHNLTVRKEVTKGLPSTALEKRAADLSVDLIVIGAKGFSPSKSSHLSPAAHKVAHYAGYSVLVARPSKQIRPLNTVVAVDATEKAWRAVEFLSLLSLPQWAKVTVVNVGEKRSEIQIGKHIDDLHPPSIPGERLSKFTQNCAVEVVDHLRNCGVRAHRIMRIGDPADEILTAAQEQNADLIVIGVRDQASTNAFRWRSVAHKVVKYAPCSVLAVRNELQAGNSTLLDTWNTLINPVAVM